MNNQIFWIASYPKSGNTLMRSIIISLFFTDDGKFYLDKSNKINQFDKTVHVARNKKIFNNDISNLSNIQNFYKYLNLLQSKEALGFKEDFIFLKTHSGLFEVGKNAFTRKENTRGIIYIVRDPRDVCISWSKHSGISLQESIDFLTNDLSSLTWVEPKQKGDIFEENNRPRSLLSSWEKHVLSWTSIDWNIPKIIIKFEDLVYDKEKQIKRIVKFFEKNYGFNFYNIENKIKNIIETTDFKKLKRQEEEHGFIEASNFSKFFSVGKKNQWKGKMSGNQISQIELKFKKVMKQLNYKI